MVITQGLAVYSNLSIPVLWLDIVNECFRFLVAVMIMSVYDEERQLQTTKGTVRLQAGETNVRPW